MQASEHRSEAGMHTYTDQKCAQTAGGFAAHQHPSIPRVVRDVGLNLAGGQALRIPARKAGTLGLFGPGLLAPRYAKYLYPQDADVLRHYLLGEQSAMAGDAARTPHSCMR